MWAEAGFRHFDDPTMPLLQGRFAGKQRGGMAVRPHAEQHDIEERPRRIECVAAVIGFEHTLVGLRGVGGAAPVRNTVDIIGRDRHMGDHRVARHAVIAVRMVPPHKALVAQEQM